MELKQYAQIVWKRAWIPCLLLVIVAVASLLTMTTPPPTYNMTMRFNVGVKPQAVANEYVYDGYYAWIASEYMTDNLTGLVSSQNFADDVNRYLADMGNPVQIPAGIISAENQHRILRLNLSWQNPTELADIAKAIARAMEENSAKYFPQAGQAEAFITMIDTLGPFETSASSLWQRLDLPVRLILALAAGLALTFLLDYLDDSVRGRAELEVLGVNVLAEVPKK
jgi:capsular polysaccharide biosynthesis protein